MIDDAKFEDAREAPLHLRALDAEDLQVVSTLVQDAVFPVTEMKWDMPRRRFALLINRFRWEDVGGTRQRQRAYERVQSLLFMDEVRKVTSQGVDRTDKDLILSLLSIAFLPGKDGTGRLELTLAGDGAIALEVEALDVTLKDVTRPYSALSRNAPAHPD